MKNLFELKACGSNSLDVHSRNHCNAPMITPTDDYYNTDLPIYNDSILEFIREIPGVYLVEKINPYFLRITFGRLFTLEEISEKVRNIYWYVCFGEPEFYNSTLEREKLKKKILNEGSPDPGFKKCNCGICKC